jgi:hypothetical protein
MASKMNIANKANDKKSSTGGGSKGERCVEDGEFKPVAIEGGKTQILKN